MSAENSFLPYGRQCIDDDDIAAVVNVLRGDWLTTGPNVAQFEAAFGKAVGARETVVVSSGTAALHVAAAALGLGPGDVVIVPTVTFLATANAARFVGADVVFSDVDPDSGLMRPEDLLSALERCKTHRVRAVFPVHLGGQCVDSVGISAIARQHGLAVVEDACHALGTRYVESGRSVPVGACKHSDLAAFSLHPVKTIAMGEGGVVTTDQPELAERLRRLRNHGLVRDAAQWVNRNLGFDAAGQANPWYYEMPEPGFNYRASDIHCALGLSQLAKLERFVEHRRRLVARYDELLSALAPVVSPMKRDPHSLAAWHLYVALIDFSATAVARGELMRRLHWRGVGTQVHYIPVHLQPYYAQQSPSAELRGAQRFYERCLSLPLFPGMDDSDVERVVRTLGEELKIAGA